MSNDVSGLRAPLGADGASLQRWGFDLINRLRILLAETSVDVDGVSDGAVDALQDIVDDFGTITDFDDLSDAEKISLGLSDAVADQLAIDDVLADMARFNTSPGLMAVHAYLRAHQNDAGIRVEQTVRTDETLSLSNQIISLTADLADTDAAVVSEQTARADGDSALASDITSVTSTVAGHTTTISQHQSSIDGIEAEWGVSISAQGQVTGLIRLDSNATESTFTVVVDKFQVAKIDGTGIVPIFQVGTVGGVSRVALAGDMLVDGYIVAQHVAANTLTANEIAANTITAAEIAATTITSSEIAAGAIIAGKIAANAVTATEINVTDLSAIAADFGTVTAGRIESADGNSFWDLDTNVFQIGTV